jgi:hypothetical protein
MPHIVEALDQQIPSLLALAAVCMGCMRSYYEVLLRVLILWVCMRSPLVIAEGRILFMVVTQGPFFLFCKSNRTKCVLLVSIMGAGERQTVLFGR